MRTINFSQWRVHSTNRRCLIQIGIDRIDLLSIWWWKGGRIGVTLLGFGIGMAP